MTTTIQQNGTRPSATHTSTDIERSAIGSAMLPNTRLPSTVVEQSQSTNQGVNPNAAPAQSGNQPAAAAPQPAAQQSWTEFALCHPVSRIGLPWVGSIGGGALVGLATSPTGPGALVAGAAGASAGSGFVIGVQQGVCDKEFNGTKLVIGMAAGAVGGGAANLVAGTAMRGSVNIGAQALAGGTGAAVGDQFGQRLEKAAGEREEVSWTQTGVAFVAGAATRGTAAKIGNVRAARAEQRAQADRVTQAQRALDDASAEEALARQARTAAEREAQEASEKLLAFQKDAPARAAARQVHADAAKQAGGEVKTATASRAESAQALLAAEKRLSEFQKLRSSAGSAEKDARDSVFALSGNSSDPKLIQAAQAADKAWKDAVAALQKFKVDNKFGSRTDDEIERQLVRNRGRVGGVDSHRERQVNDATTRLTDRKTDLSDHDAAVKAEEHALSEARKLASEGRRIATDSHRDAAQRTKDLERQHAGLLDPKEPKEAAAKTTAAPGRKLPVRSTLVAAGVIGVIAYESSRDSSGNPSDGAFSSAVDTASGVIDRGREAVMGMSEKSAESSPTSTPSYGKMADGLQINQPTAVLGNPAAVGQSTGSSSARQMNVVIPEATLDEIIDRKGDEFFNGTAEKYKNNPNMAKEVQGSMADPLAVKAYVEFAGIMRVSGVGQYSATSQADVENLVARTYERIAFGWAISAETQIGGAVEKVSTEALKYRSSRQGVNAEDAYPALRKLLDTDFPRNDVPISAARRAEIQTTPDGGQVAKEVFVRSPDPEFGSTDLAYQMTLRFERLHRERAARAQ